MLKYLIKRKWFKSLVMKIYNKTFNHMPVIWELRCGGFDVIIIDLDRIKIGGGIKIKVNWQDTRVFKHIRDDGSELSISYLLNEYSHLPQALQNRMVEIFKTLGINNDDMDIVTENVTDFFGTEEL